MKRTLVMSDVHGYYLAMVEALENAKFDKEKDRLIFLGDIADRGPQTYECVEYLMTVPDLIHILGNHDYWTLEWLKGSEIDSVHMGNGGKATISSYLKASNEDVRKHVYWLMSALDYYQDEKGRVFTHGGFDPEYPLDAGKDIHNFSWTRKLVQLAVMHKKVRSETPLTPYPEVYVGHTPTQYLGIGTVPTKACEIWLMDTGCGFGGPCSVMDIDTKEIWQSRPSEIIYKDRPLSGM